MSDLSNIFQAPRSSFRITDKAVANFNEIVGGYAADKIEWDLMIMPKPSPQGLMFGLIILMTIPVPLLGSTERFVVAHDEQNLLQFDNIDTVRQLVFQMVQELKAQHAEYLRGNN